MYKVVVVAIYSDNGGQSVKFTFYFDLVTMSEFVEHDIHGPCAPRRRGVETRE
jgi:hypothetical protein